jgi:hypothetical protein
VRILGAFVIIAAMLLGCSHTEPMKPLLKPAAYQWQKGDHWMRLYWNYAKNEDGTITARGFVEPQDPRKSLHSVNLRLVGLDGAGAVVSEASGSTDDMFISGQNAQSEFAITITPSGDERRYTVGGEYHYYLFGTPPDYTNKSRAEISLDPPR